MSSSDRDIILVTGNWLTLMLLPLYDPDVRTATRSGRGNQIGPTAAIAFDRAHANPAIEPVERFNLIKTHIGGIKDSDPRPIAGILADNHVGLVAAAASKIAGRDIDASRKGCFECKKTADGSKACC